MEYNSNILERDKLQFTLSFITLFIGAYEHFSSTVMQNWESFLTIHGTYKQGKEWERLKSKKVDESGNKDLLKACMLEFVEMDVITKKEYNEFLSFKKLRLKYAHETMNVIFNGITKDESNHLSSLIGLWEKIENWWINEIEMPGETNDFDKKSSCSLVYFFFLKIVQVLYGETYTQYCKNKQMLSTNFGKFVDID